MSDNIAGPTVSRIQLGRELQRLREAAGVSRQAAAATIGCSPARIGHIELGRNVVGRAELIVLVRDYYKAGTVVLDALEELRQRASKRGWWSQYALPEWLAGYVGLEHGATSVCSWDLELIPGLLQTEQYARTLYALRGWLSAEELDRHVAARIERQQRLVEPNPLHLTAIVSQAALQRCARHTSVAAAQLAQLSDRAQWPNIELRVLPFDLGLHVGVFGQFSLLSFSDRMLTDVAYQEYTLGGHVVEDESVVALLATLFDELRSQALGTNESLTMIEDLAQHLR